MKTTGINEIRAMVAEALPNAAAAQKLTDAIVRATELAEDETRLVSRDYLDARLSDLRKELADLRAELVDKMRSQQMWTVGTFILLLASVVLQHVWK
jgi:uncharacterized small protein (DUF1192 family)